MSPAHLERDRIAPSHSKTTGRLLPDDGARRYTWIGLSADDRDPEALLAERVGGTLAIDADDVRHDIRGRKLTAVEENRYLRRARAGRWILGDNNGRGGVGGSELRD